MRSTSCGFRRLPTAPPLGSKTLSVQYTHTHNVLSLPYHLDNHLNITPFAQLGSYSKLLRYLNETIHVILVLLYCSPAAAGAVLLVVEFVLKPSDGVLGVANFAKSRQPLVYREEFAFAYAWFEQILINVVTWTLMQEQKKKREMQG